MNEDEILLYAEHKNPVLGSVDVQEGEKPALLYLLFKANERFLATRGWHGARLLRAGQGDGPYAAYGPDILVKMSRRWIQTMGLRHGVAPYILAECGLSPPRD
jgi:hypothetical protein